VTNYLAGPLFISDPENFLHLPHSLGGNFLSAARSSFSLVLLLLSGHGVGFVVFCSSWQDLSSFRTPQVFFCCPVALGATFVSAAGSTALLRSCSYWHLRLGSFLGQDRVDRRSLKQLSTGRSSLERAALRHTADSPRA